MSPAVSGVVLTPLATEQRALIGRLSDLPIRSGRGPVSRLSGTSKVPVLVAGVAGALDGSLKPGDLVVADAVHSEQASHASPAGPLLAGALRRRGLKTHVGAVVSRRRVVDGAARQALTGTGALAVDTESAYLAEQAPAGQLAVVRAIVDTPAQGLFSLGTPWRGVQALRSLRAAAPVIDEWRAATGHREVVLAGPRSFCAGVERAIEIVERALQLYGAPVYVRRQIVHNTHVVAELTAKGAIFVEEVGEIPRGAVAVLAAHGVSPVVRLQAVARDLQVVDATCPLVTKVHAEVKRFAARGETVFLIGHADHEEVVGTVGEAPDNVVVIESAAAARAVTVADPAKVSYVMQTTLAVDDAEETAAILRGRFPGLSAPRRDDICYATTNRQQAVRAVARETDIVLVLGSPNSSNSHRLAEVAAAEGVPAYLVDDASAVDLRWLAGAHRVGITAGASAPPHLVDELVTALSGLGNLTIRETSVVDEDVRFTLPREVS